MQADWGSLSYSGGPTYTDKLWLPKCHQKQEGPYIQWTLHKTLFVYVSVCVCVMSVFGVCKEVVFYVWNFRKLCLCPSATPAANEAGREATLPLPGGSPGRLLLSLVQPAGGRPGYPLHWGEHQRTAEGAVSPPPEPREQEREGCVCVCACVCMRVCAL